MNKELNKKLLLLPLLGASIALSGCPKKEDAPVDTPPGGMVKKTDTTKGGETPKSSDTPKDVAVKFAKAITDGDAAAAKSYILPNPDAEKAVETLSAMVSTVQKFATAADEKFGESAKAMTAPMKAGMPDLAKQVGEAEVKETGDTATLTMKSDTGKPLTLKKMDGTWKIDGSSMKIDPNQVTQMQSMVKVFSDATDEIKAGKFKTFQDFAVAYQSRMQGMMGGGSPPGPGGNAPSDMPPGPK